MFAVYCREKSESNERCSTPGDVMQTGAVRFEVGRLCATGLLLLKRSAQQQKKMVTLQYFDIAKADGTQSYVDIDDAVAGDPGDSWWNTLTIEVTRGEPILTVTNRVVGSQKEVFDGDVIDGILSHGMPPLDWMDQEVTLGNKVVKAQKDREEVVKQLAGEKTTPARSVPVSESQQKDRVDSPGFPAGKAGGSEETENHVGGKSESTTAHMTEKPRVRTQSRAGGQTRIRRRSKRHRTGKKIARKALRGSAVAKPESSKSRTESLRGTRGESGVAGAVISPRSPYLEAHLAQVLARMVAQICLVYNKRSGAWPRSSELCQVLSLSEKLVGEENLRKNKDESKKWNKKREDEMKERKTGEARAFTNSSRRPSITFSVHLGARGSVAFTTVKSWRYTRAAAAACLAGQNCVKKGDERHTFLERIDKTFSSALNGRNVTEEELDSLSRFASQGCSHAYWD